jgi:nucleoside-diphosphate-sugar epimerase
MLGVRASVKVFYLIGSHGRLAKGIAYEYVDNSQFQSLSRADYEGWAAFGAADKVSRYFDKPQNEGATLFVASGLLDPRLPKEDLYAINFLLPKNLIDGASKVGMKVITFGTVMENFIKSPNPYIQTKVALKDYIENIAVKEDKVQATHLQMHTLYGVGQPSSFMFLGQILHALKANEPFKMTSGRQLREYHHIEDEIKAIKKLASADIGGVYDISHGNPVSLSSIAESAFDAFGKKDLLHISALVDPAEDNYEKILKPTYSLEEINFRNPLPGIVKYLQECVSSTKS